MIIKNGHVVDPKNNIDKVCTLVIKDDKIEAVVEAGKNLSEVVNEAD